MAPPNHRCRWPLLLASKRSAALVATLVLALASGGGSASECRAAAVAQAEAENVWGSAIEAHNAAHETSDQDHPGVDERLLSSRVEMIIASEAVRRACR